MNTAMTLPADETCRMKTNHKCSVQSNILPFGGAWGGLLVALITFGLMIMTGCGGRNATGGNETTATNDNQEISATTESDLLTQPLSEREAIELLFNSLFDSNAKKKMDFLLYSEEGHYRYNYDVRLDNDETSKRCIDFYAPSSDSAFYIFHLYEPIFFDDGEFSHSATYDFYAVNRNTGEIVAERDDKLSDEWNENFPW
jgi:hypothetical protein